MLRLKKWIDRQFRREVAKPPQLVMWYTQGVPPGLLDHDHCQVREYRPGDEPGWLDLLQANGELGVWDRARLDGVLADTHVQLFIECEGRIAACTGVNDRQRAEGPCWEIGWVAVHPDFQGRGLGKLVVRAALARAVELGSRPIYLLTDDFRIPAMCCYLKLGFVPDANHPTYPERWRAIFAALGPAYQGFKPQFIATGENR